MTTRMMTPAFFAAVVAILLMNLSQYVYAKGGERSPALEAFATYEDMQRYFANRNLRSLRFIENPTDDSYINAFNQHNEQPSGQRISKRHKRSATQRKLPSEPTLVKFEIADAVEPSAEVKELIRQHRSRDLKQLEESKKQTIIGNTTPKTVIKKNLKTKKLAKRTKRFANQQPANFQVKMIPFEASDAREPDAQTKKLIKRMRSIELEKLQQVPTYATPKEQHINPVLQATATMPVLSNNQHPASQINSFQRPQFGKRTYRRIRRSAPQMIKFELEDAKEPNEAIKNHMKQQQSSRESKDIKELSTVNPKLNVTQTAADRSDMAMSSDQSSHESRRYYVYKDVPVKSKKSVNSLPHEVQHVITHLLKENHGGKAYVKYIPAQQVDYGRLKSYYNTKLATPGFGGKIQPAAATYVKYVQQAVQKQPEQLVQIHTVPVVEKIRYVYTPVAATSGGGGGHGQAAQAHAHAYVPHNYVPAAAPASHSAAISQPIVVHETAAEPDHASHLHQLQQQQQAAEVHHTYTADLSHVHHSSAEVEGSAQAIKNVPAPHFRPSKPDPLLALDDNKLAEGGISEQYKYELYASPHAAAAQQQHEYVPSYAKQEAAAAPVIKIEYHAAPDALKENYKELHEFKELSALMGKSPEDQIHGLTYLLAKEMQSKLQFQRQHKQLDDQEVLSQHQRPQDNTAPILFHPEGAHHHQLLQQQPVAVAVEHASSLGAQKFIGMAKTKQYIPIVEGVYIAHGGSGEQKPSAEEISKSVQHFAAKLEPQAPHPSSFIEYGLSPNYAGLKGQPQHKKVLVEQVIHHPTVEQHHGLVGVGAHHGLQAAVPEHAIGNGGEHSGAGGGDGVLSAQGLHDSHDLQYASKYAFGYRIRDFHTGNDFGHKQNRDLNGVTRGQYHILLPDGRIQNVIYHADDTGFHADVSFESGHR